MVQWLGLRAFTAEGPGSIPGWGTKILQAATAAQKKSGGEGGGAGGERLHQKPLLDFLYKVENTKL